MSGTDDAEMSVAMPAIMVEMPVKASRPKVDIFRTNNPTISTFGEQLQILKSCLIN